MPGLVPPVKIEVTDRAADVGEKLADALFEFAGSIDRLALAWEHHTQANARPKTPRV